VVGLNENQDYFTIFPQVPSSICISRGELYGFDFNRDPHYLERPTTQNRERRIVLKVHYLIYPRGLRWYALILGWLTTQYDIIARFLFLKTIKPQNAIEQAGAGLIIFLTKLVLSLLYSVLDPTFFIYATSYLHYLKYIIIFAHMHLKINYYDFQRDAIFWKSVSLFHLTKLVLLDYLSITPIPLILILGYSLSSLASIKLGVTALTLGLNLASASQNV